MSVLLGYAAMLLLGVVLGLIGAGGSILTVPVLVYLLAIPASQATGYSLAIVGATALAGAVEYLRRGQSHPRMAVIFGTPAILGVYLTRRYIFPAVPDPVAQFENFVLGKDVMVMLVFAAFMLLTAIAMIRNRGAEATAESAPRTIKMNYPMLLVAGFAVGIVTGFVGAGGGFMILPVLVLLGGLPMKIAIGTDLLIIAAKSLLGFIGEAQVAPHIDYGFVALITLLPLAGIVLGTFLNKHVPAARLKTAFGYFVLVMGIYIVVKELFLS
ncbi:MAG: sulfite exporter TauE/SafE family protein [candidate division KSB1 bacterium]